METVNSAVDKLFWLFNSLEWH